MINDNLSFEYSDTQWPVVVGTIPATKAADPDLMVLVRQRLEEAASNYRALTFHHRQRFPKGKRSLAIAWKRRRGLIAKALAGADEKSAYATHLRAAYRIADGQFVAYDMLGKGHKGTRNPARDMFYACVLDVWTRELQGELTTGSVLRKNGRREATSPAIRFFEAVVGPIIDRPIKRDAIAKVIVAERKHREKPTKPKAEIKARTGTR